MNPPAGLAALAALGQVALALLYVLSSIPAHAWGPEAHRAVASEAEAQLTAEARAALRELLGEQHLADLANDLDTLRDEPAWAWSKPLHYVNIELEGVQFDMERDCPEARCAVGAVRHFAHVLADPEQPRGERLLALQVLVHVAADLHQPLHAGYAEDRGGNDLHVLLEGQRTNLHAVWDDVIGERAAAAPLRARHEPRGRDLAPETWANESFFMVRQGVYATPAGAEVPAWYLTGNQRSANQRLAQAAARLAGVLDIALTGQDLPFPDAALSRDAPTRAVPWDTVIAVAIGALLLLGVIGVGVRVVVRRPQGLWRLYLSAPGLLLLTLTCVGMISLADVIMPFVYGTAFDDVLVGSRDPWGLLLPAAFGIGAVLVALVGQATAAWTIPRIAVHRVHRLRVRLATGLVRAPTPWLGARRKADLLALLNQDIPVLQDGLVDAMPRLARGMLSGIACIGVMLWVDWRLFLVTGMVVPLALFIPRRIARSASRSAKARQQAGADLAAVLLDALSAVEVIRAFGLEPWFERRFSEVAVRARQATARSARLALWASGATAIAMIATTIAILGLGVVIAIVFDVSAGGLIASYVALINLAGSVNRIGGSVPALSRANAAWARLSELDAELPEPPAPTDATAAPLRDGIRLDNLRFSHDGVTAHLDGVDLTLPVGRRTAIIGPSGSGKSTLLRILLTELHPDGGALLWDDIPFDQLGESAIRARMGFVPQRPQVFSMSVKDNLRLGAQDASDEAIREAARAADVHDAIAALPAGYDTPIGDGGAALSGGQLQRLCIARALVRHPDVLVLDEATSALDPATASQVLDALLDGQAGRTVIAVTHRLDVADRFDEVVLLADGRVVDAGPPAALQTRCELYRQLRDHQSGFDLRADGRAGTVSAERLGAIPVLADLPAEEHAWLADRATVRRLEPDETLFHLGDTGDHLVLLARGQLLVLDRDGEAIRTCDSGDVLGEIGLLTRSRRTATVRALGECTVFLLYRDALDEVLARRTELRARLEELALERLSHDANRPRPDPV